MPIIQPQDITATGKKFSTIIYGEPGIGKSTLALSAPNPVFCDFDRGVLRVRAEHRKPTLEMSSYDEFLEDLDTSEIKQCETVIIDTAGSMVSMMYAKYDKQLNTKDPRKVYGAIKTEFSRLTGQIRDALNKNVIYIFHSVEEEKNDKAVVRLLCEGSAKNLVWAPCDFGGYLYKRDSKRYINFTSSAVAFAKGCHGIHDEWEIPSLEPGDKNDFVTRLFEQARKNIADDDGASNAIKAQYEIVMERGMKIIATITDEATANAAKAEISELNHFSTSKKELSTLLTKKAKTFGLTFDKKLDAFVAGGGGSQ